ncbi:hypothetical protein SmJEL517_g00194 [Synchytrium microbalum]|uniref:Ras-GEF domain-containing protein n=1 Tax=Synchytrium microbalum TaxID=1806994 RepID=A0A507CJB9_9FUNG|nr:uncharacterized protein SmJEL517_g00194 [Synchytrium microbalum]TPX38376.1 hypothetical protein SmJEL517_g00194 [Synchytrium microbalum]
MASAHRCGKTELVRSIDPDSISRPTRSEYGHVVYSLTFSLNEIPHIVTITEMDEEAIQPDSTNFKWPEAVTNAHGVLLCYDTTNRMTFMTMPEILDAFAEHKVPIALVGCKAEASNLRDVDAKLGSKLALLFDCQFREISMTMPAATKEFFGDFLNEILRRREIVQQRNELLGSNKDKLESKYDSLRMQLRLLRQQNQAALLASTAAANPSNSNNNNSSSSSNTGTGNTTPPRSPIPDETASTTPPPLQVPVRRESTIVYPMPIMRHSFSSPPRKTTSPPTSPTATSSPAIKHASAPTLPVVLSNATRSSAVAPETPEIRPVSISTSDSLDDESSSRDASILEPVVEDESTLKSAVITTDDIMNAPVDSGIDSILDDYAGEQSNHTTPPSGSAVTENEKRDSGGGSGAVTPPNAESSVVSSARSTSLSSARGPHLVAPNGFTIEELIDRLTSPEVHDMEFTKVFLMLYRKFLRPSEFLDKLMDRFDAFDSKDETVYTRGAPIHPVQLRVCNVLIHWCQEYWPDFASDRMRFTLHVFLEICSVRPAFAAVCQKLASLAFRDPPTQADREGMDWGLVDIDEMENVVTLKTSRANGLKADKAYSQRKPTLGGMTGVAASSSDAHGGKGPRVGSDDYKRLKSESTLSLSSTSSGGSTISKEQQKLLDTARLIEASFSLGGKAASGLDVSGGGDIQHTFLNAPFLDLDNDAIAQQLNLLEWETFSKIKPRDLVQHIWSKKHKGRHPPTITASIDHFNFISKWVQTRILLQKKIKMRAKTMIKFMKIAMALRNANNFNSLMAVLAGLNSAPIARLHNTRKLLVDRTTFQTFEALEKLMSSEKSFSAYRFALKRSELPCIPYLGLFFRDLLYIDEMNKDRRPDGTVNLPKFLLMGDTIMMIRNFQQRSYQVSRDPYITRVISDTPLMNDDDAYNTSLEMEPRAT